MLSIIVHFVHCLEYINKSVKTKELYTKCPEFRKKYFIYIYVLCCCSMLLYVSDLKNKKRKTNNNNNC